MPSDTRENVKNMCINEDFHIERKLTHSMRTGNLWRRHGRLEKTVV